MDGLFAQGKSSFETGDFTGWNVQGKGWTIYSRDASDGSKSALCTVSKGEPAGVMACAKVVKAQPGFVVKVDLDLAGKARHNSSRVKISVICVDAGGGILQEVEKTVAVPSSDFHRISVPELIVPAKTAETYVMLMVEVTKTAKSTEWWRFDNVLIRVE
ncbi:hypothetical protein [Pontiella agarivorans]|uniref:hypothetical protein n=1 Tax=Pontiella agarivorans TaxID=3038953 RepID=UPI002AD53608|nr:hypothetical protein [Pontiella agarivorans]